MSTTHTPPAAARARLGSIAGLLGHPHTRVLHDPLRGATFICILPGGQLYFESGLELDTDGSIFIGPGQDPDGKPKTSANDRDGHDLDADDVNYFVLPGGGFTDRVGINLGDIAVVIHGDRLAYACFGDFGPDDKLGEGSIALHRDLGFERVVDGRIRNNGIDRDVVTIVFPSTGLADATGHQRVAVSTNESMARGVLPLLGLAQAGDQFEKSELARLSGPRALTVPADRQALVRLLRPWVEELVTATPHPPTLDRRTRVESLLATAKGLDVLLHTPPTTAMAGGPEPPHNKVYARFDHDTDADGRWYVRGITFHLDPQTQAAAEQALAADQ